MRLAWLTDIHLNFLNAQRRRDFAESVVDEEPDAVLIGGDISEAHDLAAHLKEMAQWLERPIYFVLGNHDFYRGSFEQVYSIARRLSQDEEHLTWLTEAGVVELTAHTALIDHDGWTDARSAAVPMTLLRETNWFWLSRTKSSHLRARTGDHTLELVGVRRQEVFRTGPEWGVPVS